MNQIRPRVTGAKPVLARKRALRAATATPRKLLVNRLLALTDHLSSAQPLATRLTDLCRATVELLGCDRSCIFLHENGSYRASYNHGDPPDLAALSPPHQVSAHEPLIAEVMRTRHLAIVDNAEHSPLIDARRARRVGAMVVVPLFDEHQQPLGLLTAEYNENPGAFSDIRSTLVLGLAKVVAQALVADRRAAAVQESQRRYEALVASLDGIVWEADATFQFSFVSEQTERLLGYPVARWIAEPNFWEDHLHPEDREWAVALRLAATQQQSAHDLEYRMIAADGRVVWLRDIVSVVVENGRATRLRGIMVDISRGKQTEAALRASEALFRSVIEHSMDAVTLIGADGTVRYRSPSGSRILGYAAEHDARHDVFGLIHPDDAPGVAETFARILTTPGGSLRSELRVQHSDGSWRWIEVVGTNLLHEPGVQAIVANYSDVTERKHAATEIRQLNESLERRVRGRTAELETANKELEAFSYSVSHDLRVPLRAIDGFSKALVEDCAARLDDDGHHYLGRIRAATQRMGMLIDALLALSRLSRSDLHRTGVDVSELARSIAMELLATAPERPVEFVIAPGVVADADARLLRVVLENLLGNAWKYTARHASARIEVGYGESGCGNQGPGAVRQSPTTNPKYPAVFFVRDDGAGFDMAFADKLFATFQRLHTAREFDGNGIGLATVKRIIHRHGGHIWAEAAVEQGATFYFTLG